jgi:excisionase family DNA binding protein
MSKVAAATLDTSHETEPCTLIDLLKRRRRALTIEELADLTALSRTTIYDAAKSGDLKAMRFGGTMRVDPKRAIDWLVEHGA